MALYFKDKSQGLFEEFCKAHGREVPVLKLLWGFKDAGLQDEECLVAFYNTYSDDLVFAQTVDDISDVNFSLSLDIKARFYFINHQSVNAYHQSPSAPLEHAE